MNNTTTNETTVLPPLKLVQISRMNEQAITIEGLINPEWLLSPLVSAEVVTQGDVPYMNVKIMAFLPDELENDSFELFELSPEEAPNLELLLKYKKILPNAKSYFAWYICYEYQLSKDIIDVTVIIQNNDPDNGNPRTSRGTVTQIIQSY
ncbi:hypothetical protein [Flavobacterium humi]|uniref:Uncharacterized protein n=1 Tax=Flavobacterium humi TaxID=2562683 RepID=A0A4Z0L450_9FLAO|nr:hypothetical protein [Flavobacterium humi]TGD57027.1 hypothetical protein E4635_12725 [Flavobacterium humi]